MKVGRFSLCGAPCRMMLTASDRERLLLPNWTVKMPESAVLSYS